MANRRQYSAEFKQKEVRLVREPGETVAHATRDPR